VKGADKYNELLCQGIVAARSGKERRALEFFLSASQQPVLESPNILLFGRIAKTYALLGKFREANVFLEYDNLTLLWAIGIVRCEAQPSSEDENLLQDGKLLQSDEAKHMAHVLCGPIFDNDVDFTRRDADSFVQVAKAILRHRALHEEIILLREKQRRNKK